MKTRLLVFVMSSLLALPAFAQVFEVGDEGFVQNANNWPTNEGPEHAIDGVGQKYLNFAQQNTGIAVTMGGGPAVAIALTLWTGNDAVPRDPASFSVYGTNDPITASNPGDLFTGLTLVASDAIALPDTRNAGGAAALDPANSATVGFANSTAYSSYLVLFPTVKDGFSNSMQVAEVSLNDATGAPIFSPNDAILGVHLVPEPVAGIPVMLYLLGIVVVRRR